MYNLWKSVSFVLLSILFLNCEPGQLAIDKVELCDYFTRDGVCREATEINKKYQIEIPNQKKPQTWEDLSNYLYFHARETPGFILRTNRKFTPEEKKELKESYFAMYDFAGERGKMEGLEMGEDWIGSFNYLGTMIKQKQKKENKLKSFPYETSLFPANLEFFWSSKLFTGSTKTKINLTYRVLPPEK
ncbi:hypothetical protein CH373_05830 [Leptospira perolatii]|uniref:Uncharacterized protein n=1 Tax=Leptospira perolatii TaxID=2023191 RepID=A0A2M9ZQV4_9LEPT|nr:hypothetical protein [Leptospira perolatii]PJZ68389.1 hypothetical protein CH360_16575 [Leptospira perolatii]PJZ74415.1 hypothetical protein CH373_05830 [Leptospira perolatii]